LLEIDGSQKSGSGTILRLAVALAAIRGEPLHIYNVRQNRPQQGLKPQHLEAVLTAAKLCNAELEGASLGNREIWFKPKEITGGNFEAEIGTAGSIPMLFMTVLPICLYAKTPVCLHVTKGGTDTMQAPTMNYIRNVFLNALKRMGVDAEIAVQKYGYYPKGMGEATLIMKPTNALKPLRLETFGQSRNIKGVSVCTGLADRRVAERQAKAASDYLSQKGYTANIEVMNDSSNPMQKESSLALWAETDTGAIIGSDAIGELKKPSENVGIEAAEKLSEELSASSTVDVHLADMLVPYMALAEGNSAYLTRKITDHLEANIWLTEKILNTKFNIAKIDNLFKIEKVG